MYFVFKISSSIFVIINIDDLSKLIKSEVSIGKFIFDIYCEISLNIFKYSSSNIFKSSFFNIKFSGILYKSSKIK